MNELDKQYQNLLKDILENGVKKEDRTGTGIISVFGRQIRHKMSDGFPLLTSKRVSFNLVLTELLWFLRGDTNIKFLLNHNCHIWDGDCYKHYTKELLSLESVRNHEEMNRWMKKWPDGTFSLYTKEEFIEKIETDINFAEKWGDLGPIYGKQWRNWQTNKTLYVPTISGPGANITVEIDQIKNLINDLKFNPDSRRLMVSAWNPSQLEDMVLPPCHYGFQLYTREIKPKDGLNLVGKTVTYDKKKYKIKRIPPVGLPYIVLDDVKGELIIKEEWLDYPIELDDNVPTRAISLMFNMRSNDVPLGLPFNIASYGLLLEIISKMVNMIPDELIGNLGDAHIYLNQIDGVKEQLTRTPMKLPNLIISDEVNFNGNINEFLETCNKDSFKLDGYESYPSIKMPLSN